MSEIDKIKTKYQVKEKKLLSTYNDGYIGKNIYEVTLNNGNVRRVEQITKGGRNGDAVIIVPMTKTNRFVIIVESRPNTRDTVCVEFPAGMVDPGETYEQAAARELEEETGYTAEKLIELEWHYQDQGCSSAIIKSFLAINCEKTTEQRLDDTENIDLIEMTPEEVEQLIDRNEITDSGSKLAFFTYTYKKQNNKL